MRKQTECSNTTKKFITKEKGGRALRRGNEWQQGQDALKGSGKNVEGFSFRPASPLSPAFEAAPGATVTHAPKASPIQMNVLKERKSKATKSCPEIYLAEKAWIFKS